MIDHETHNRFQGIFGWGMFMAAFLAGLFIAGFFSDKQKIKIHYSEMPKKLYCQPFTQPGNDYHRAKEGFKPVMWQELNKAFYNQSQGKGEVIGQTILTCFEKLGSSQTVSADMYFYRSAK